MTQEDMRRQQLEVLCKKIARNALTPQLPRGIGFTLLIFEFGADGLLAYVSNAQRDDMIATMKNFIALLEGRVSEEPSQKQ